MAFRRSRRLSLAVLLALPLLAPAAAAWADSGPSGAAVVDQCHQSVQDSLPGGGAQTCRSIQAQEGGTAAACRTPLYEAPDATAPEDCAVIDGRAVSEAQVAHYEAGWTHRALGLQRALHASAPLLEEEIPHTHNSFNASPYKLATGYYATLTN